MIKKFSRIRKHSKSPSATPQGPASLRLHEKLLAAPTLLPLLHFATEGFNNVKYKKKLCFALHNVSNIFTALPSSSLAPERRRSFVCAEKSSPPHQLLVLPPAHSPARRGGCCWFFAARCAKGKNFAQPFRFILMARKHGKKLCVRQRSSI